MALRHDSGLSPPAFEIIFISFFFISESNGVICSTKSPAYPIRGSFVFALAKIDMVTSAKKSKTR